jgi:hypothetical protein
LIRLDEELFGNVGMRIEERGQRIENGGLVFRIGMDLVLDLG